MSEHRLTDKLHKRLAKLMVAEKSPGRAIRIIELTLTRTFIMMSKFKNRYVHALVPNAQRLPIEWPKTAPS
jgi:hypothetical protein